MHEFFHYPCPVTPGSVVIGIALSSSKGDGQFISEKMLDEFILPFMLLKLNYNPPPFLTRTKKKQSKSLSTHTVLVERLRATGEPFID